MRRKKTALEVILDMAVARLAKSMEEAGLSHRSAVKFARIELGAMMVC